MIDIIPPEEETKEELRIEFTEEQKQAFKEITDKQKTLLAKPLQPYIVSGKARVADELHELNKTLKEILREMRKRKV